MPAFGWQLVPMWAGTLALGLTYGAYGSEIVRGALNAVDPAQKEGGIALSFTPWQRLRLILLPQAVPEMIPSFCNLLVELLKGTALVSITGMGDLAFSGNLVRLALQESAHIYTYLLLIYFALTAGSFAWGWLGDYVGLPNTLLTAAILGSGLVLVVRTFSIDLTLERPPPRAPEPLPLPEAPAAELISTLRRVRGRVMETVHYRVSQEDRSDFLHAMAEVRKVRGRAGAMFWQLYEDVAHPEGWMEVWSMESWTDHLREVTRLSEEDRSVLARAGIYRCGSEGPRPARYIAVDPH